MIALTADFSTQQNKVSELVDRFLQDHPEYLKVAREKDPALDGKSDEEIRAELSFYPGVVALAVHEEAHKLYKEGGMKKVQARMLAEAAKTRSGIDIHPGTDIGANCFIDHGTGVVIGETAKLGKDTLIYHGVTLGAYGRAEIAHRHPEIGKHCLISVDVNILGNVKLADRVTVSPKAILFGNNLTVGKGVVIGAGAMIGDDNQIADGVRIGAGAVIPRGTGLIDKDVPSYQEVSRNKENELQFGVKAPAQFVAQLQQGRGFIHEDFSI